MIILTITYTRIAMELWGQTANREVTKRQRDSIQSKRKVVKMLITVVLIFGICWFPQQFYCILISIYKTIPEWPSVPYVYLISYLFAMTNSMYNPFLYYYMDHRFRNGFRRVFRFCRCIKWSSKYSFVSNVSCRSSSEPTALSVIYSCRRRSCTMIVAANSPRQSTITNELPINLNLQPRQN
ncbi:unnamed protein product [Rotaria sp. Silwood1]|nr:unnamed protein product [Rotaria sp. Silwood1]